MTICFLTCAWKRPRIFDVFLKNYIHLKNEFKGSVNLKLVVVGNKEEDPANHALAAYYGDSITWVHSVNLPLGKKWNTGLEEIKNIDTDYIMIMGSDDLVDKKLIEKYIQLAKSGVNYVGVTDLYFMNSINGQLGYWPGYINGPKRGETIGCARMFKKSIAAQFDFKMWNDGLNKSLDGSLTTRFKKIGMKPLALSCKKDNIFVMDLKSETNIWPFSAFIKVKVDAATTLKKHFPENTINAIKNLKK